jgi:DtxR family Mn-dependent transcriptional regulator
MEDYLEAIYHIAAEKGAARAKDIAKRLKVNSSSVTGALQALSRKALVNYAPYDVITLTQEGTRAALDVIRRHEVLRDFFVRVLHVEEAVADDGACKMEHSLPRPILERLTQYIDFLEACPRAGTEWLAQFGYMCEHPGRAADCERCTADCLEGIKSKRRRQGKRGTARTLTGLKPGEKARIVKVRGGQSTNKRISEMGVGPGNVIEVEEVGPDGDPMEIKVKGHHISLKKREMDGITVEVQ